MNSHVYRDGEGVLLDECVKCGHGRRDETDAACAPPARRPTHPEHCCHPEKCIEAGRCARTIHGEPWTCID